ncbi:MAG: hypothetical protein QG674_389 [Patescibacteria group bacterium]|nr:hypothetical protein [Patescibacteria group bacterium]
MLLSFNNEVLPTELTDFLNPEDIICPNPTKVDDISWTLQKQRPCLVLIEESVGDRKKIVDIAETIIEAAYDYGVKTKVCLFAKDAIEHPHISWVKNFKEAKGLWDTL